MALEVSATVAVARSRSRSPRRAAFAASSYEATAHAQDDSQAAAPKKPKKKKPKPKPAEDEAPAEAAPAPAPVDTPAPAPAPTEAAPPAEAPAPGAAGDDLAPITDVYEKPAKTTTSSASATRTVIPKFMMNLFVDEGTTVYSNSVGIELDIRATTSRSSRRSTTSATASATRSSSRREGPSQEFNYSDITAACSDLRGGRHPLVEGHLEERLLRVRRRLRDRRDHRESDDSWITNSASSSANSSVKLNGSNGQTYSPCATTDNVANSGCNRRATRRRAGEALRHTDPNWFNGARSRPCSPDLDPELGLRFKPIKEIEARLILGFHSPGRSSSSAPTTGSSRASRTRSSPSPRRIDALSR